MNTLIKLSLVLFALILVVSGCAKTVVLNNTSIVVNMSEDNVTVLNPILNESVVVVIINSSTNLSVVNVTRNVTTNVTVNPSSNSKYSQYKDTDLISDSINDFEDLG